MKEFVLIFRNSKDAHDNPSPAQLQERMNWMAGVAARNLLVDKGNRLSATGAKTVKPNNLVTDGPYTEIKEFITGYMLLKAATIDEAVAIAQENPMIKMGGNIEIREVLTVPGKN